jgi:hypothetical protein
MVDSPTPVSNEGSEPEPDVDPGPRAPVTPLDDGAGVCSGLGCCVGSGVGFGVGSGLGSGVGLGDGPGFGLGVGDGDGAGLGVGLGFGGFFAKSV